MKGARVRHTQGPGIDALRPRARDFGRRDEPLEVQIGRGSYYYHADGLGSITELTKSNGSAVNTYTYAAFGGDSPANTETVANPFHFTAREYDPETKLYYYRARYYDPLWGRFLSEDPIEFDGGFNFYTYVGNDPIGSSDPLGLFSMKDVRDELIIHRTLGVDQDCDQITGGACTRVKAALLVCTCSCSGSGWKAKGELRIYGDIYVYSGPFATLRVRPKDKSVVDAKSAIAHEHNAHIKPAIDAVTPLINSLEQKPFRSKSECYSACDETSTLVNALFRTTLLETQRKETKQ
jgi:RHS repeat-associated protein